MAPVFSLSMTNKEILVLARLAGLEVNSATPIRKFRRCMYHNSRSNRKRKDWHKGEETLVMRLSLEALGGELVLVPVCEKHLPLYLGYKPAGWMVL
jgi:hypothetical protein